MSTVQEIEMAIERLPEAELTELATWLEEHRLRRAAPSSVESWLAHARGAARPGITTEQIMSATRGEE